MTVYNHSGSRFWPAKDLDLNIKRELPVGTYLVGFDQMTGRYYLEQEESFKAPKKIYGDTMKRAGRIINTFKSRSASTGVILAGEKGSGKTLLTKMLSVELAKEGIPTIIVNRAFSGDAFNQLIAGIDQPAYVLFDEFEKVYYETEMQNALLTLFDGLFTTKKLFAITSNEKYRINEYMINRPGRFFYSFTYAGLGEDFIREYLADNLHNKENIDSFVRFTSIFSAFSFDMLQALVEEMNRYDETVVEAAKWVNVSPVYIDKFEYEYVAVNLGKKIPNFKELTKKVGYPGYKFNPFVHTFNFTVEVYGDEYADEEDDDANKTTIDFATLTTAAKEKLGSYAYHVGQLNPQHIVKFDSETVTYDDGENVVVIRKVKEKDFNVMNLM